MIDRRFKTEEAGDKCYDHLSVYDGFDTSAQVIVNELCGNLRTIQNYNSTASDVTLHFISDESAKDRGFAILILVFSTGMLI